MPPTPQPMPSTMHPVEDHYFQTNLYESILRGLEKQGIPIDPLSRAHLAAVDEFHVRGAAVSKELARKADLRGKTLLDIGCGIGGAARMLREEFDCRVTGLDLSSQYIETAQQLTRLVGINDNIQFLQGDALDLPLEDQAFDVVWTQHVQMNIRDKARFYQEIARVLRAEGQLLFYEIWKKGREPISFPVPWAGDPSISFLAEKEAIHQLLLRLGFTRIDSSDETEAGIHFFEQLLDKLRREGPPAIGLNLLMGGDTLHKITHLLDGLKRGALELESACYRRGAS